MLYKDACNRKSNQQNLGKLLDFSNVEHVFVLKICIWNSVCSRMFFEKWCHNIANNKTELRLVYYYRLVICGGEWFSDIKYSAHYFEMKFQIDIKII